MSHSNIITSVDDIRKNLSNIINTYSNKKSYSSVVEKENSKLKSNIEKLHLAYAPNIIEWIIRPEFLNFNIEDEDGGPSKTIYDHGGQYEVVRDSLELMCPICSTKEDQEVWKFSPEGDRKMKGREFFESQPLLVWSEDLQDDACPKCCTTRSEFKECGLFVGYESILLIVGMRAAKSVTAALIATYMEHLLLTHGNPQQLFKQIPGQAFTVSFVATTAGQSEKTVFQSYSGLREHSPWIANYKNAIVDAESFKGQYYNDGNKKKIEYRNLRILFESLNSNSSGVAGDTRIGAFIDELSRFDSTESKRSAKEMYRVFNSGLKTVRAAKIGRPLPNCFGLLCSTTSPIAVNDYAMKLSEKASDLKKMYYKHSSTWEFNPYQPKESFAEDFKLDPVGAERDFGANPPNAEKPLITDPEMFKKCIDETLKPTVTFLDRVYTDPHGREYVGKAVEFCQLDSNFEHVIVGDAGKVKDSFTLCSAHGEWTSTEVEGKQVQVWCTVFDWLMSVRPTQVPKRLVHFESAEKIIEAVSIKQKIKFLRFDRWNSESILQKFSFKGIDTGTLSVNTAADYYLNFTNDAYTGKVKMLPIHKDDVGKDPYGDMSDYGRAIHELLRLERSKDLKKVDHRAEEHNDLAVIIVGAHHMVQNVMGKNNFTNSNGIKQNSVDNIIGTVAKFRRW